MRTFRWLRVGLTLKTQLTISFMVVSIFALALSAFFIYNSVLNMLQENSEKATVQLFRQAEYSIQSFREEVDKVSKTIIVNPNVQTLLDEGQYTEYEQINVTRSVILFLDQILSNNPFIDGLYILNEKRQMIEVTSERGSFTNSEVFVGTEIYRRSKENFPFLTWDGANVSVKNTVGPVDAGTRKPEIISAGRGIKSLNQTEQTGTLIININQARLNRIYGNLSNSTTNDIYILDERGTIISSNNEALLGKGKRGLPNEFRQVGYGSTIVHDGNNSRQVVFYRIGNTGWTMVKEIPFAEFYRNIVDLRRIIVTVISVSLVLSLLISFYWIRKITTPLKELGHTMKELEKGQLGVTVDQPSRNELGILARQFNRMSSGIAELVEENKRIEDEKRKLEIQTLQFQINPHFLYNTLNTIKSMAIVAKANNVAESLTSLGTVLRPIFRNPSILARLDEEIDIIVNYTNIMNHRYGKMIRIDIGIDESLLECEVLRFMFQPIVENCFLHGFPHDHSIGTILLSGSEQGEDVVFSISDTGVGIPEEQLAPIRSMLLSEQDAVTGNSGIGLSNVNRRIRLHFGRQYGIEVDSRPGEGTMIMIRIPKIQK